MTTISEIKKRLNETTEREPWMAELETDSRKSVQSLLRSWNRTYEKKQFLAVEHERKQQFDQSFLQGAGFVAGVDEAGRGPLAGPVVTAAVILPEDSNMLIGLDDSKKLSRGKRESFANLVKQHAVSYVIHVQPPEEIDRLNIYEATKQSMTKAVLTLAKQPQMVLADAMMLPLPVRCESIIKGDAKSLAIAAASVLAKTERDRLMAAYAVEYPEYGFEQHAGYGTKDHLEALSAHGVTPIHRKTFEPVKSMIAAEQSDEFFS